MATKTKKQKLTDTVKKMAKKTESKTDKDALKSLLLNDMKSKKEEERLQRVEENKDIMESVIYTKFSNPLCKQLIDKLEEEGIAHIQKPELDFENEVKEMSLTTGQIQFPTIFINGEYLVANRDFQNIPQVIEIIRRIGKKGTTIPSNDVRIIEGFKNLGFGMSQQLQNLGRSLQQINQQLGPIQQFIDKLKEEIESEDA